jgi:hypothetical protein
MPLGFRGSQVSNTTSLHQAKRGSVNQIKTDPLHCERSCSPDSNDSGVLNQSDGWTLSRRVMKRNVCESAKKRTPAVYEGREDPSRHRLPAPRLHHHRHLGWRREGCRGIRRNPFSVHHHLLVRSRAALSSGMAHRLRIRRRVHRLVAIQPRAFAGSPAKRREPRNRTTGKPRISGRSSGCCNYGSAA